MTIAKLTRFTHRLNIEQNPYRWMCSLLNFTNLHYEISIDLKMENLNQDDGPDDENVEFCMNINTYVNRYIYIHTYIYIYIYIYIYMYIYVYTYIYM